jgi:hypothetical protein
MLKTNELLITHQSDSHRGRTYIAPYKEATVDDAGVMRITYWAANENFKSTAIPTNPNPAEPAFFNAVVNVSEGAVVEADVVIPAMSSLAGIVDWSVSGFADVSSFLRSRKGWLEAPVLCYPRTHALSMHISLVVARLNWRLMFMPTRFILVCRHASTPRPGVMLEMEGAAVTVVAIGPSGVCEVYTKATPNATAIASAGSFDRALALVPGSVAKVKLLYRRDMLELYLDNVMCSLIELYLVLEQQHNILFLGAWVCA